MLGVVDQNDGASVVARKKGAANRHVLWDINFDTGTITLNSSGGQLAITPKGNNVSSQTPLVLSTVKPGTLSQRFDVISKPGFLLSMANAELCIDNDGRGVKDGNTVWLYNFNGSPAQQWRLVPLMNMMLAE
ncbi:RICIN domain-containing protein [Pseudomonas aeruginosa]